MYYAVSENRGLVMEKGKGTDQFLNPLSVQGPFQSQTDAETQYGKKLNSIMGYCEIIEVRDTRRAAFFAWVHDVTARYQEGTLQRQDLRREIQDAAFTFRD